MEVQTVEHHARIVAKVLRFNMDTYQKLWFTGDAAAIGKSIGNTPALQHIAEQMSEDDFAQVLKRALQMVAVGR